MVLNTTMAVKQYYQQEQAKKRQSIDNSMIRFPKLDECAHFHFEYAELVSAVFLLPFPLHPFLFFSIFSVFFFRTSIVFRPGARDFSPLINSMFVLL